MSDIKGEGREPITLHSGTDRMKPDELLRRLRRLARRREWTIEVSEGRNHTKVRLRGRRTVVSRHSTDLKTGTLIGILRQLEIDLNDLEGL